MSAQLNFNATCSIAQNRRGFQMITSSSKICLVASDSFAQGRNTHYDEEEFKLDV